MRELRYIQTVRGKDITIIAISDVIPTINRDKPHLVWLDYESILTQDELSDNRSCIRGDRCTNPLVITIAEHVPVHNMMVVYHLWLKSQILL